MPKKEGLGLGGAAGPPQAEVKSFGKGGPTASLVRSYCKEEFSACSKISLWLCTGYGELGLKAVKCILAF